MPPFDPVRDAVLNSPISQSRPLPSPNVSLPPFTSQSPSYFTSVAAQAASNNAVASPSPTSRRPTDLSMLLNADDRQSSPTLLRRPSSSGASTASTSTFTAPTINTSTGTPRSRSAHLSNILLPRNEDAGLPSSSTASPSVSPALTTTDILAPSLSRASVTTATTLTLSPKLVHERPDYGRRESSASSQSVSTPRSPESGRGAPSSKSPAIIHPLPPKPQVSMTTLPEKKRSAVPYAPRNRITEPKSVLVPLTPEEVNLYSNLRCNPLRNKRQWEDISRSELVKEKGPAEKKARGDVGLVVQHYNQRPDVGVSQRQHSPIIGLKSFNNWVKSVLIARFAHPALHGTQGGPAGDKDKGGGDNKYLFSGGGAKGKVLDMGCGKGGDLNKWQKARVKEYIGVDIADVSIQQARSRYMQSANSRSAKNSGQLTASFYTLDCYTHPLTDSIPSTSLPPLADPFDVVSMQFCMHYAFENVQKVRMMLENVTKWLRPGGVFVGTIPNDKLLLEHLDALSPNAEELSFGNDIYRIRFNDYDHRPLYGHRYWFYLQDAVENVPEYIVRWDDFIQLASEYGLDLLYRAEFHEVYAEHCENPEFKRLLRHMKVVNDDGESAMDEDQWEAANVYIAFAFQMR